MFVIQIGETNILILKDKPTSGGREGMAGQASSEKCVDETTMLKQKTLIISNVFQSLKSYK
jgi:hypothetical protein